MRRPFYLCHFWAWALFALSGSTGLLLSKEIPRVEPAAAGMSADALDAISSHVAGWIQEGELAGAITAVMRQGRIVHLEAHGEMAPGKPMQEDAIFRIYSMTKPVTTAAALMLHDDGKFDLDDPVSRFLPAWKHLKVYHPEGPEPPRRAMTVRDLMRHTSGLTYGFFGNSPVDQLYRQLNVFDWNADLRTMVGKLEGIPLAYEPGADWTYSLSTDVLGHLVEVWSGQPLDVFLQQRLFDPLDMKDTSFQLPPDKVARWTAVYSGTNQVQPTEDWPNDRFTRPPILLSGGGGLLSTMRDYLRFLQMIANGGVLHGTRILRTETAKLMTTNQLPPAAMPVAFGPEQREGVGFGLGFSVRVAASDWDAEGRLGEYGWGGMASTHCWVSPRDELVVVTLEQTLPYNWRLEFGLKGLIYDALKE